MCTYAMFTAERQIVIVAIAPNWAVSPYRRPPIWQAYPETGYFKRTLKRRGWGLSLIRAIAGILPVKSDGEVH